MDEQEKEIYKFANRKQYALYLACKTCTRSRDQAELSYYLGNDPDNKCNLSFDKKFKYVMELRQDCSCFQDYEPVERDTTYPGATFAPWDKHDHLKDDSSDLDFNPDIPKACLSYVRSAISVPIPRSNNWEKCLNLLFDRKVEEGGIHKFPAMGEVLRLLCTSQMPELGFRIGLPPQRGLGFDRGLWFYRSEKYNFNLEKNKTIKSEMKKIIMVYLYHVWFKRLPVDKLEGTFLALDISNPYALGKDLAWWMVNVFKDETAKKFYPDEPEMEIEFVSLSLLDKAREAAQLAESGCSSFDELDAEAREYDQMLQHYGYDTNEDGEILDTDGKEIF